MGKRDALYVVLVAVLSLYSACIGMHICDLSVPSELLISLKDTGKRKK